MADKEFLGRAMKLCSSQEYAASEIIQKLYGWGASEKEIEDVIQRLIEEKFLDEFRMAKFYVHDKFCFNQWGKIKIRYMLEQKCVPKDAISQAISTIDEEGYRKTLYSLLNKKLRTLKETDDYVLRAKMFQFACNKGFETELIHKVIDNVLKKN